MKGKVLIAIVGCIMAGALAAVAQVPQAAAPSAEAQAPAVVAQAPQATAPSKEKSIVDVAKALLPKSKDGAISLKGYVQGRYTIYEETGKSDGFSIKSAYIVPYGTITPGWDFEVEIDAADTTGKVLRNAFIEYNEFKPWTRLRLGQQKPYFSEEYWTSSAAIDTIERSKAVTSLSAERDIGLNLLGDAADGRVKYGVGVFNGSGVNTLEDNNGKDVAGRVMLAPLKGLGAAVDNLQIGGGAWTGSRTNGAIDRYVGTVVYKIGKMKVQGEYLFQNTGAYDSTSTNGVVTDVAKKEGDGWYTLATYDILIKNDFMVQPVVKYESYEPNRDKSDDKEKATTVGANVFFNKYCKLMLNYMFKDEEQSVANNIGIAQLQVQF